jgi:hypothetical protein
MSTEPNPDRRSGGRGGRRINGKSNQPAGRGIFAAGWAGFALRLPLRLNPPRPNPRRTLGGCRGCQPNRTPIAAQAGGAAAKISGGGENFGRKFPKIFGRRLPKKNAVFQPAAAAWTEKAKGGKTALAVLSHFEILILRIFFPQQKSVRLPQRKASRNNDFSFF